MITSKMNIMVKTIFSIFLCFISIHVFSQNIYSSYDKAKQHALVRKGPAPDFFEGALIGNGGMGVVVCTRPDAVVLRFGHNDVWDIRIAEDNRDEIGTFQKVYENVKAIDPNLKHLEDDPWYAKYKALTRENYTKPYPRPFPCGSVILGFDRREVELIGHSLDISDGLVKVKLLLNNQDTAYLHVFTDMKKDRVWMKLVDQSGHSVPSCFNRINVIPDKETPEDFVTLLNKVGWKSPSSNP
jgi:alpha-L-fucosidase 2